MNEKDLIVILAAAAAVIIVILCQRRQHRLLLERIRRMTEDARKGVFHPETVDESMISSVENDVAQFLQEYTVSEKKLKEQKNRIETLISDISHQVTTPLSNIMVYSQMLEEMLTGSAGQQAAVIRQQAEKLDFLLKSLVKISRLETGIINTRPQRCNLTELMQSVTLQERKKAENGTIQLVFSKPAEPVWAMCDPKWTREACANILDNAVKYTQQGGLIRVSITAYSMFARIDIRDTGMGIAEAEIPKIFGRFYRSPAAAQKEGVGLGLYLSRAIVESQGGYIKVSSNPGQGSCFSVFLPAPAERAYLSPR